MVNSLLAPTTDATSSPAPLSVEVVPQTLAAGLTERAKGLPERSVPRCLTYKVNSPASTAVSRASYLRPALACESMQTEARFCLLYTSDAADDM
eukprot:446389-Rhodomonas_salina.1